jgi:hypothetical protein
MVASLTGLLGPRCLRLAYVPPGYRISTILRDGRDITNEPIDFAPDQQVDGVIIRLEASQEVAGGLPPCNSR